MITKELGKLGPPVTQRTVESSLTKAVPQGDLRVVKSEDDGALYVLASYADAHPAQVEAVRNIPFRMLQRQDPNVESKAVRRWRRADGLKGMHDLRPGHKCLPCGNVPHCAPDISSIGAR
jgi:hypothetical protein